MKVKDLINVLQKECLDAEVNIPVIGGIQRGDIFKVAPVVSVRYYITESGDKLFLDSAVTPVDDGFTGDWPYGQGKHT